MTRVSTILIVALSLVAPGSAGEAPILWHADDVAWSDHPTIPGARRAVAWGDPDRGEHGTLHRWKARTKAGECVALQETRFIVVTGTFSVKVGGEAGGEFGPGGIVRIPGGSKFEPACEAAGECNLVVHSPGPEGACKTRSE